MNKRFTSGVWAGFLLTSGGLSLYADLLGKEAYISHLSSYWIDWRFSVPIAAIGLAVAVHEFCLNRPETFKI